jgi:hypothetical protein
LEKVFRTFVQSIPYFCSKYSLLLQKQGMLFRLSQILPRNSLCRPLPFTFLFRFQFFAAVHQKTVEISHHSESYHQRMLQKPIQQIQTDFSRFEYLFHRFRRRYPSDGNRIVIQVPGLYSPYQVIYNKYIK